MVTLLFRNGARTIHEIEGAPEIWKREQFDQMVFGDHLPAELWAELDALVARLGAPARPRAIVAAE